MLVVLFVCFVVWCPLRCFFLYFVVVVVFVCVCLCVFVRVCVVSFVRFLFDLFVWVLVSCV